MDQRGHIEWVNREAGRIAAGAMSSGDADVRNEIRPRDDAERCLEQARVHPLHVPCVDLPRHGRNRRRCGDIREPPHCRRGRRSRPARERSARWPFHSRSAPRPGASRPSPRPRSTERRNSSRAGRGRRSSSSRRSCRRGGRRGNAPALLQRTGKRTGGAGSRLRGRAPRGRCRRPNRGLRRRAGRTRGSRRRSGIRPRRASPPRRRPSASRRTVPRPPERSAAGHRPRPGAGPGGRLGSPRGRVRSHPVD